MPFKEVNLKNIAKDMDVSFEDLQEKQRLMDKIRQLRLKQGLSQVELAEHIGVSQSRIAQIESGVGTRKVTFDVLFHILHVLGYGIQVRLKKVAHA